MNKAFKNIAVLLILPSFIFSACSNEVDFKDNYDNILSQPSEDDNDNEYGSGFYGYSIGESDYSAEYNGEELFIEISVANSGVAVDYGFSVYVNGILTESRANDSDEYALSHSFDFDEDEEKNIKFSYIPYNCQKGEVAQVSVMIMLAPGYNLKTATQFAYGNYHKIGLAKNFELRINADSPEKEFDGIYTEVSKEKITEEFREEYISRDPMDPSIIEYDAIKSQTNYQMYCEKPLDWFFPCEDSLDLTVRSFGKSKNFLAAIYIDHKIVPAFDGKYYALFNVDEGENISYTKASIDTSALDEGVHHIYMIAMPLSFADGSAGQTATVSVIKGEELINQAKKVESEFWEQENSENNKPDEPTENEQSVINLDTNSISGISMLDENTLIARCMGDIQLYDLKENKIIKKISLPEHYRKIQIIDDGFVVHSNSDVAAFDIYDTKGNLVKHVDGTADTFGAEEFSGYYMVVSNDGKRVAYTNPRGVFTNSIDFDDEVLIQSKSDTQREYEICLDYLYKDGEVFCCAVDLADPSNMYFASYSETTKELTTYHNWDREQQFTSQIHGNSFVVSDTGDDRIRLSDKLYYYTFGDSEMSELTCEDPLDNKYAYISDGGKYILSVGANNEAKIYDTETGEVLWKNTYRHGVAGAYIDENARKVYIVSQVKIWVYNF